MRAHFQVIEDKRCGLLYAFWTQASREGAIDQHIAFSKSADRGRTWTEPVILAGSPNKANPGLLASWQQPMLAKTGRLYCLWNLSVTNSKVQSFGACWGAYSDDGGETWSRPQSTPLKQMVYDAIADARRCATARSVAGRSGAPLCARNVPRCASAGCSVREEFTRRD